MAQPNNQIMSSISIESCTELLRNILKQPEISVTDEKWNAYCKKPKWYMLKHMKCYNDCIKVKQI